AALPAALLVVSLVFAAVFKYLSPPQVYPPGLKNILQMEWSFLSALSGGVMGLMVDSVQDLGSTYVVHQQYATAVILLILLVASLWASPRTWKLWIALLGVL